jgi:hypothetical protein
VDPANNALAADIVNGFFCGLAATGVDHIDPRPREFEAAFSRAWAEWKPASCGELAEFTVGRYGYKALLYTARRPESLFQNYRTCIEALPQGLTVKQVLNACSRHATPIQWQELAGLYLRHAEGKDALPHRSVTATTTDHEQPPSIAISVPVLQRNGIRVPGGIVRRTRHNALITPGHPSER